MLADAPWLGRPTEIDSNQIKMLTDNNQHLSAQEIADIFKISKSITLLVKIKNVSFISQKKLNELFGQPNTIPASFLLPLSTILDESFYNVS